MQLMVATAGDPRRPGECVEWNPPKVDPDSRPPDFLLLIGAMVGLGGLYMRVRPHDPPMGLEVPCGLVRPPGDRLAPLDAVVYRRGCVPSH